MNMNKISVLINDFMNTDVIHGSKIKFFFFYWETKLISLLRRAGFKIGVSKNNGEFFIKNKVGVFVIPKITDDTLTICSNYFEKHLELWLNKPKLRRIIVDIGANRGRYTILALQKYGYGRAIAIEPNPSMCKIFWRNIELNKLSMNVALHQVGVGRRKDKMMLIVDGSHAGGGRLVNDDSEESKSVSIEPLDFLVSVADARETDFIKIDTEGFEMEVLAGGKRTLSLIPKGSAIMIESERLDELKLFFSRYGIEHQETSMADHLFVKY